MSLKSILVHVDQSQTENAVKAAALLADKFDAHVSGLGVEHKAYMPSYVTAEMPYEIIQTYKNQQKARLDASEARFKKLMTDAGRISRSSFEITANDTAQSISQRSRVNDLIIVDQDHPGSGQEYREEIADDVIVASEGGVMVVPYIGYRETIGNSVLIAWNDTHESARAVRAAMPLLETADKVEVITVAKNGKDDFTGSEISRYLAEHGIDVTLNVASAKDIDVANVILNIASEHGHDLIVMGGYSHMRLREAILGGTTRDILKHMTVPVIFAH